MALSPNETRVWRYPVRGGRVFCPRRSGAVAARDCPDCQYLQRDLSTADNIVCLPPQGQDTAEMIETVARG